MGLFSNNVSAPSFVRSLSQASAPMQGRMAALSFTPPPPPPPHHDTTHLEKGAPAVDGILSDGILASTGSGGAAGGALSLDGDGEDDESSVLPYRTTARKGPPDPNPIIPGTATTFRMLKECERRQGELSNDDQKQIWQRSEAMARDGSLVRLQVGKLGITPSFLDHIGNELEAREIIRLDVQKTARDLHGLSADFLEFALPMMLDCVPIKVKGHSLTLFRDQRAVRGPPALSEEELEGKGEGQGQGQWLDADEAAQGQRMAEALVAVHVDHGSSGYKSRRGGKRGRGDYKESTE